MKHVGVIGCGAMGRGMVKNLSRHGYSVHVYDVQEKALNEAEQLGGIPEKDVPSIARQAEVLILSLPTTELVENALTREKDGAFHYLKEGSYVLDMSTTDVMATKKLHKQAQEKGIFFFDCPVSGGPEGADSGNLTIMAGGNPDHFNAIKPVLHAMGKEIDYLGDAGAGQTTKLCCNLVVAGIVLLLSESLLTGTKSGVPAQKIADIMQKGSAQNRVLSIFGPNILKGSHDEVKFLLKHMTKDIQLYMNLAKEHKIPAFLGSTIQLLYDIANHQGKGGLDTSGVSQVLEDLASCKIDQ
ncbi:3-hydroxyisobutyrate dehydrogenase [Melghiribacillus thermohalophilus]|uniref:3-hydroxyisobutyrate dehydrogenase n=1 Tax=Melghiribacillus thermohalophilus TaxID=1324956 RepID=A0A4R3NDD6_9BACI|nr:NAD(P)-dependent oxidoreductase [Melghiribacillus thermohalophilus]TCT26490.1 3-hydroxyisobutyrate dehydrogenase [Melghiribacillus thermohalophilus]